MTDDPRLTVTPRHGPPPEPSDWLTDLAVLLAAALWGAIILALTVP